MIYAPSLRILIVFFMLTFMGCGGKEQKFIPLDHMTFTNSYYKNKIKISYYVLIADPNTDVGQLKKTITRYVKSNLHYHQLMKESRISALNFVFYKKTDNTSYFIKHHEEHNAMGSEEIAHYKDDYVANYNVAKCNGGLTEKIYLFDTPEEIVSTSCK